MKIHLAQIPEAGLHRSLRLELAAMARLADTIGPQAGQVLADVWIKNREGNVEIAGTLQVHLEPPCQRCLDAVPLDIDEPVRVALVPEREYDAAPEDLHLGADELEVSFYAGEQLDLGQILEDELLLLIPEPVAEEDDDGRCVACGRAVDEVLAEQPDTADENHPFAQLKELLNTE